MSSSYPFLFKAMSSQQFTLPSSWHLKASPSPSSTPRPSITKTSNAQPSSEPDIFAKVRESGLDIRYTTVSDGLPIGFDRSLNFDQFTAALLHVFSAHVDEVVGQIVKSDDSIRCLIADTFFVWPSKIAKKFGLLYVSFWTEPALVFSLYYHMDLLMINGHFACQGNLLMSMFNHANHTILLFQLSCLLH